ncbi:hypothetical protein PISMIDRAFT_16956 [Pisolithus microcarpus 441]|uniref:Uncharacterized protein n=1 Tax=Pisolithus microcarpus 441 TaxID=765257 RepID=A0A0C9YDX9_9AGAM|nr:hypothetical protein PISMIDRAFT_16956 [Pisolithus microcarpus 441]
MAGLKSLLAQLHPTILKPAGPASTARWYARGHLVPYPAIRCKSSRPQKQPPPLTDDDDTPAPPPRKKARVAQGGQTPQSGAAASTSSAPQRRITLVVRPPQDTSTHPVPPAIRPESSTYTPLPAPPIPPSVAYSPPPTAPSPPQMSLVDATNLSIHCRLDDIIRRQDLIHGRVDETDMRLARWERRFGARIGRLPIDGGSADP